MILVEQQALEGIPLGPLERPRILGRCQLFKFAFGINPFQVSPDIVRGGFEKLRHLPLAEPHGGLVDADLDRTVGKVINGDLAQKNSFLSDRSKASSMVEAGDRRNQAG